MIFQVKRLVRPPLLLVTVTGVCPDSKWQVFFRPTTMYCIRVYTSPTLFYNQAMATANCASIGATLAGLEANEERLWTISRSKMSEQRKGFFQIKQPLWQPLLASLPLRFGFLEIGNQTVYWKPTGVSQNVLG